MQWFHCNMVINIFVSLSFSNFDTIVEVHDPWWYSFCCLHSYFSLSLRVAFKLGFMNKISSTQDSLRLVLLDTSCPGRLKFLALVALLAMIHKTLRAVLESAGSWISCSGEWEWNTSEYKFSGTLLIHWRVLSITREVIVFISSHADAFSRGWEIWCIMLPNLQGGIRLSGKVMDLASHFVKDKLPVCWWEDFHTFLFGGATAVPQILCDIPPVMLWFPKFSCT